MRGQNETHRINASSGCKFDVRRPAFLVRGRNWPGVWFYASAYGYYAPPPPAFYAPPRPVYYPPYAMLQLLRLATRGSMATGIRTAAASWWRGYGARPPYGGAVWVRPRYYGGRYYRGYWHR